MHIASKLSIILMKPALARTSISKSEKRMADAFGCKVEKTPFYYLGLPTSISYGKFRKENPLYIVFLID